MKLNINKDNARLLESVNKYKITEIRYMKHEIILKTDMVIVNKNFSDDNSFTAINSAKNSITMMNVKRCKLDILDKALNDLSAKKISSKSINNFVHQLASFLRSLLLKRSGEELPR